MAGLIKCGLKQWPLILVTEGKKKWGGQKFGRDSLLFTKFYANVKIFKLVMVNQRTHFPLMPTYFPFPESTLALAESGYIDLLVPHFYKLNEVYATKKKKMEIIMFCQQKFIFTQTVAFLTSL